MKRLPATTLFAAMLTLALAACDAPAPSGSPSADDALPPASDQPADDVPPATAPVPDDDIPPATSDGLARWDGYDEARFGMSDEEVREVWDGELNGNTAEGESCFHLNPVGQPSIAWFALMFGDGQFVRYSVANDEMAAPGGGKRGMAVAQIEQLYPGRIEQQNHKYVQGGHYLRIEQTGGGDSVLIFETDADGTVTEWRVGVPPQVDYIEGCA